MTAPRVSQRALDTLKGMDKYTRRILLFWFMKNVVHGKQAKDSGKPLNEEKTIWQYRTGNCRLICCFEDFGPVLLAITQGLPAEYNKLKTRA
ncbi:MAG: type II toxin-antitoxin system mRNA interferase toxin, RelE/StbE family [Clostridia bacterium]|nr:type II toxin-antitoxin system mRNA interferase toxin, RelE/StbE family [Clostridia bacterium]